VQVKWSAGVRGGVSSALLRGMRPHYLQERQPHVLLTTTYKPSKVMFHFLADMLDVSHLTVCHPPCPNSPCTAAHCRKTQAAAATKTVHLHKPVTQR
jgi:hypothetical protein